MSVFVKLFSAGEKVRKKSGRQANPEQIQNREELLMKKAEYLKKKTEQALQLAKNNCRKNRQVALQALRRKKYYEKNLRHIDGVMKAMTSAQEHTDMVNKVNDLIKNLVEEPDVTEDMSDNLHTCKSLGLDFDEDELLAELERLEKNLDENFCVKDWTEERDCRHKESTTAPPSTPEMTEEDEVENALEFLRRWANDSS